MSPATTRRGFLRLAAGTAALGALARIPALPASARAAAAEGGTAFFDAGQRDLLASVMERMVAGEDGVAPPVRETRAVATVDALCAELDPAITGPLPLLLRLVEWGPIVFDFTFTRFSRLDAAGRDASLRAWMTSRIAVRRLGFQALRNLCLLGWYAQPESWRAIGYAGPLLGRRPA